MTTHPVQAHNPGCPCGSGRRLDECCGRYLSGAPAPAAESLMRSRYSAYALGNIDYLLQTTLPAQQSGLDREAIRTWSLQSTWLGLEVEAVELPVGQPEHAFVTFSARWHDASGAHAHRERSAFVRHAGRWYFIDPTVPLQVGRNDPCPCGNGLKFKKCCADALRQTSQALEG
ncbi:SEC-C motif-containing protein [Azotobacter beijerinckii]|uniref:UPF0225 protein SAMN04244579_02978 n=1 Tax=Azotobacter beijerinckii TaxID=170623 RepID=A0A1H6W0I3_9GAMM|nr:YchJ family protein [Azotobacter beijerinckii]SEJ06330.1 SEC-C motif-containing protein [Azotobacter beijerinckii]